MRADFIDRKTATAVFKQMQPINRLICEVCMDTGLRVDDVCSLHTNDVLTAVSKNGWLTVKEMKTGKVRKVHLAKKQLEKLLFVAGELYVFEHRNDSYKHRTRQTVWKDLARSAKSLREQGVSVSPHSLRKLYAVELFEKSGDLAKVQKDLNHDNLNTTVIYCMSKEIAKAKMKKQKKAMRSRVAGEKNV
ncbi:MAG: tyrosine-type recombinase/integrase [Oscillospiraceae bacterium]|nr:tyrosine-type recombinase/integrase [Oscillospiraceae bacterium]